MEFLAAKCPSCGGDIQLPKGVEFAKCMYCGSDVNVQRAVQAHKGTVNLENIRELAKDAAVGGNYVEAYRHAGTLLEHNPKDSDALLIKGEAAGMQSTLAAHRLGELIQCVQKAVEVAPEDDAIRARAVLAIMSVGGAFHNLARGHLGEFPNHDTWGQYIGWLLETKALYTIALDMNAGDKVRAALLHRIIELYRYLLEGYTGSMFTGSGEMPVKLSIDDQFKPETKAEHDKYVAELQKLEPEYQAAAIVEKGACFIATAATGSVNSKMTMGLRRFRDEVLDKHALGRDVIEAYYESSPALVEPIMHNRPLRVAVKWFVVYPAFIVSQAILKLKGY